MAATLGRPLTPRPACFGLADADWQRPTPAEMRAFLAAHGGLHPDGRPRHQWLALRLGLSVRHGDKTVRRWLAGEVSIPYSAWFTLVELLAPGSMQRGTGEP